MQSGRLVREGYVENNALDRVTRSAESLEHHGQFLWNLIMLELWYRQYG